MRIPQVPTPNDATQSSGLPGKDSKEFCSSTIRPMKRLITKKQRLRRCSRKNSTKGSRHDKFKTNTISHIMKIQETTQQALGSFSAFIEQQQGQQGQNEVQTSEFLLAPPQVQISNLEFQRTPELGEYLAPIGQHLLLKDHYHVPKPICDSRRVSELSRTKLVSWMFEISNFFGFRLETAYLAVNIADKALGRVQSIIQKLAVLGLTALFMATKYQEIMIPHLNNFVTVAPAAYNVTREQILQLESKLLRLLDFDLSYVSPVVHLHYSNLLAPKPEFVRNRSIALIKELTLHAQSHYLSSSQLAAHAMDMAEHEFTALAPTQQAVANTPGQSRQF